jgi:hypothetical protein
MNRDNLEGKALLLDHSIELGVVTIDGVLWNSGDELGLSGGRYRGIERGREMTAEHQGPLAVLRPVL